MKISPKIVNITCRFCGVVTGSREFSGKTSDAEIEKKMVEIADSRCDAHYDEHGDYSEMSKYFNRHIGSPADFKRVIADSNYSFDGFVKTIVDEAPDKVDERQLDTEIKHRGKNKGHFDQEMKRLREIKAKNAAK